MLFLRIIENVFIKSDACMDFLNLFWGPVRRERSHGVQNTKRTHKVFNARYTQRTGGVGLLLEQGEGEGEDYST